MKRVPSVLSAFVLFVQACESPPQEQARIEKSAAEYEATDTLVAEQMAMLAQYDTMYGDWGYQQIIDPMDDSDRSRIMAVDLMADPIAALSFSCSPSTVRFTYSFGQFIAGSDGRVFVQYRMDKREASGSQSWNLEFGVVQTGAVMEPDSIESFLARAETASEVAFRVTDPSDYTELTHRFSLIGLARAYEELPCTD